MALLTAWSGRPVKFDRRDVIINMTTNQRRTYSASALEGVSYLHNRGLAHCDLKFANLPFEPVGNDAALCRIIDFAGASTRDMMQGPCRQAAEQEWNWLLQHVQIDAPACAGKRDGGVHVGGAGATPGGGGTKRARLVVASARAAGTDAGGGIASRGGDRSGELHAPNRSVTGMWGTAYWRTTPPRDGGLQTPLQRDCTAMGVLVVSMAMGEQVAKRSQAAYPQGQGGRNSACELGVHAWLDPRGQGTHVLANSVTEGLAWAWTRRLPGGGTELGKTCAPDWPQPPPALNGQDWGRCRVAASVIRLLVTGQARGTGLGSVSGVEECCARGAKVLSQWND